MSIFSNKARKDCKKYSSSYRWMPPEVPYTASLQLSFIIKYNDFCCLGLSLFLFFFLLFLSWVDFITLLLFSYVVCQNQLMWVQSWKGWVQKLYITRSCHIWAQDFVNITKFDWNCNVFLRKRKQEMHHLEMSIIFTFNNTNFQINVYLYLISIKYAY